MRFAIALLLVPALADAGPKPWLAGRIVDPAGKLLPGARVLATVDFYDPLNKSVAERFPEYGFALAADGTFVIAAHELRPGVKNLRFHLTASADGYSASDEVTSTGGDVVVRLRPAVDHVVTVIDDVTRAPVAGASLVADCGAPQTVFPAGGDGIARLSRCDDRSRNPIVATAPGYRTGGAAADFTRPGQTVEIPKLRPLHVHLVDDRTRRDIADCAIDVDGDAAKSDGHGMVDTMATLGRVRVVPHCAGYGANLDTSYAVGFVLANAAKPLEQALRHNFDIAGAVVDASGRPIASATVEVRPINEVSTARPMPVATTTTDAKGRFHLDSFSADNFVLGASSPAGSITREIVFKDLSGPIVLVIK